MHGTIFLFPTLLVIFVSFLIVRAAAIALMMTGMDENKARFQALSAFTGTGFTTREAESIVNNPIRRRIASWLMILGYAGVVTIIVTATSSFITSRGYEISVNILLLTVGIYVIYKFATRRGFIKRWEDFVQSRLVKTGAFEEGYTEDLLHLLEGYGLVRITMSGEFGLAGKTLKDCGLRKKGIIALGIERGKSWLPSPPLNETLAEGDKLIIYGPLAVLREQFQQKPAG